jgi:outer membrane biogenesis lipoprotein LolB
MRANVPLAVALLCAVLTACATLPQREPSTQTAASTADAQHAAAVPSSTNPDAALDASLVREGYRIDRRGDQVRYCRTQVTTGTAFPSTVCLTPEQIQAQRRSLQQSQDTLVQPRGITCSGKLCSGG